MLIRVSVRSPGPVREAGFDDGLRGGRARGVAADKDIVLERRGRVGVAEDPREQDAEDRGRERRARRVQGVERAGVAEGVVEEAEGGKPDRVVGQAREAVEGREVVVCQECAGEGGGGKEDVENGVHVGNRLW